MGGLAAVATRVEYCGCIKVVSFRSIEYHGKIEMVTGNNALLYYAMSIQKLKKSRFCVTTFAVPSSSLAASVKS